MNYSVFLGPDNRFIPEGKWDEYRTHGKMTLYDLVFKRHPQGPSWYSAVLTNGKETFALGIVFRSATVGREWGCIPNPSYSHPNVKTISQQGFATRLRAAEYLMRRQGFRDPENWL